MSKYAIDFTINGLVDIEANTEEEALKKYNNLTWCGVIDNSYNLSEIGTPKIIKAVEEEEENKPLSFLEKFILGWLEYNETDKEYKRENIEDLLYELASYELIDLIGDIIDKF